MQSIHKNKIATFTVLYHSMNYVEKIYKMRKYSRYGVSVKTKVLEADTSAISVAIDGVSIY